MITHYLNPQSKNNQSIDNARIVYGRMLDGNELSLAQVIVVQVFQHFDECLRPQLASSLCFQSHVELLNDCQARQRQLHSGTLLQADLQVLDIMLHVKAWIEVSTHHPAPEHV